MDIYSSKKKARHAASRKKRKSGENIFIRIKKWFLKMPKKKRTIVITLLSLLLVLLIAIGTVIGIFLDVTKDYNYQGIEDEEITNIKPIDAGIVNIALFGIDTRTQGSFKGLSDSIMILSLNTKTGKINVISIMRDSLVKIPGKDVAKINSAYSSKEGAALAIKTLNENFKLDIKEYATVNFYGMVDIVNAVGGIEVDVQENEIEGTNCLNYLVKDYCSHTGETPVLVKKAGLQKLNGMQAVSWARIRNASTAEGESNDYGRTDRQRYVMEQLLNKALSTSVTEYPKLIKALLPHMETSLSYGEILKLSGMLTKKISFEQTRVPQHSYTISGPKISKVGSYVYYNLDFAADIIHAIIYDGMTQDQYIEQNGVVKEGWYKGATSSSSSGTTSTKSDGDSSSNKTTSDKPKDNNKAPTSSTPESTDVSSNESSSQPVDSSHETGSSDEDTSSDVESSSESESSDS